ncbi:hypothetical protein [Hymenobacter cellulosilyticus]|uniref:Uncharacterized protein n=1 Tax=Hymenobacter cellulosilyticus TaxID=2932248 RepID=A0A8T9QCE3_9BACT|nr:hypothetical protein [Hymenobacter cellulosilyticus]UOQ74602.1 hypothetical protein MUN79_12450 [Hymenobacter cellulosilyticus]
MPLTPRRFLQLTALLLPACLLLILFLDQPLALFLHQHCAPSGPSSKPSPAAPTTSTT